MSIKYYELGPDKRLSDIVFAGSHDASITLGSANAQTQLLDVAGQAAAGVRLFDLRILARACANDSASLVGYHGKKKKAKTFSMTSAHTHKSYNIDVTEKMNAGTFGLSLSKMLTQAKDFVENSNEFLIFKFDKCTNYQLIADYCVDILGDTIYKPFGIDFGKLMLDGLKKKVVCVFNDSNLGEISDIGEDDGILGFLSLKAKKGPPKSYKANYKGLQYYGKGGTNPFAIWKTRKGKIAENMSKQSKMMSKMAANVAPHAPDVLGMMYWTTTGATSSIKKRNKVMWTTTGVQRMEDLWTNGLESSISAQLEQEQVKCMQYGAQPRIKAFFPNIVMIDFAEQDKCLPIYQLNHVADEKLRKAYQDYTS